MKKSEFYRELEEVLEADSGSISGDEVLADFDAWDSLAVLTFIAMVDEKFEVTLTASKLALVKTVTDLVALLGDKITV